MAICGLRRFSNALPQRCELAKTGDPQGLGRVASHVATCEEQTFGSDGVFLQ
jgi:hypothetical protein